MHRLILITGTLLFALALACADPAPKTETPAAAPKIDVVFTLDTTGSMGGMIEGAKQKIWSIARLLTTATPTPKIRIGLVAYRDRGDQYVTKVTPLSADIDTVYKELTALRADGGGDEPESVNEALRVAVNKIDWDADPHTYRVVFLVGDAAPHMDYKDDVKYPVTCAIAKKSGIYINTVLCGTSATAKEEFKKIATLADGDDFQVPENGGTQQTTTTYDGMLAALCMDLDGTRLYYGTAAERAQGEARTDNARALDASTSKATLADRAGFLAATIDGADKGVHDLVADLESGRVKLADIDPALLPDFLQKMTPDARKQYVAKVEAMRKDVRTTILSYSAKRQAELLKQIKENGGAKLAMDFVIFMAVKEQAGKKGILYEVAQ